jgi:hypothetical protein
LARSSTRALPHYQTGAKSNVAFEDKYLATVVGTIVRINRERLAVPS